MILKEKVEMKWHIEIGTEGKVERSMSNFVPLLKYVPFHEDVQESGGVVPRICNFCTGWK
jgi:hypothetical protein